MSIKDIMIIPGNPPASHYYNLWIEELAQKDNNLNVLYDPFPKLYPKVEPRIYFQNIIDHYIDLASNLKGEKLTLVGHSIGAYFAYRILERIPHKIDHAYLIYPYFGRPNLQGLSVLATTTYLSKVPRLGNLLLNNKNLFKPVMPEITNVTSSELEISLKLAHHEYYYFKKRDLPKVNRKIKNKISFIYNTNDRWCTSKTIDHFKNEVNTQCIEADHDFVCFEDGRNKLSNFLLKEFQGASYFY